MNVSKHVQQMSKEQDEAVVGHSVDKVTGEAFQYMVVFDGHGSNMVIDIIRNATQRPLFDEILGSTDPVVNLAEWIDRQCASFESSGATMCLVKMYSTRIVCINCGDSQAAVFQDGELIYKTTPHNWEHPGERERIAAMGLVFQGSTDIFVESPTVLRGVYTEYVTWPDGNRLACTQAIGHNLRTGYCPEVREIKVLPSCSYRVVVASDGVWDMLMENETTTVVATLPGQELLDFVHRRWLQPWTMIPWGATEGLLSQYGKRDCDDMILVVAEITASPGAPPPALE